jgi:hypothetical protein
LNHSLATNVLSSYDPIEAFEALPNEGLLVTSLDVRESSVELNQICQRLLGA